MSIPHVSYLPVRLFLCRRVGVYSGRWVGGWLEGEKVKGKYERWKRVGGNIKGY
jgi:hypothetical protein